MFYSVNSAKVPISKRADIVTLIKRLINHLNSTYDSVSVELLRNVSGAGEEMHIVHKCEMRTLHGLTFKQPAKGIKVGLNTLRAC